MSTCMQCMLGRECVQSACDSGWLTPSRSSPWLFFPLLLLSHTRALGSLTEHTQPLSSPAWPYSWPSVSPPPHLPSWPNPSDDKITIKHQDWCHFEKPWLQQVPPIDLRLISLSLSDSWSSRGFCAHNSLHACRTWFVPDLSRPEGTFHRTFSKSFIIIVYLS